MCSGAAMPPDSGSGGAQGASSSSSAPPQGPFAQALAWGSSYFDGLLMSYHGCCCSTDPRSDTQGKCGDLVVMSDWDTDEHQRNSIGYRGQFHEPVPCKALEPGSPPPASSSARADSSWLKTPRAAVGGSTSSGYPSRCSESPGALDCGVPVESDEGTTDAAMREAMALRELMKRFVQEMVHGRNFPVVIGEGKTEPCKLTLTPNLLYLQLEAAGVTHDIPLRNVKDVCPGRLTSSQLAPVELDELCNTLVLRNNECVTFRFDGLKERDEFTKCVKVLALALDQ